MKTCDRITHGSLALFNEFGERNMTTNHLAAKLNISPGNLYYHFRNKEDIILSIYEEYARSLLLETLPKVSSEVKPLDSLVLYMDSVFQTTMKFRFFYSNLPVLLDKNPILREKYVEVQQSISERVSQLLVSLRAADYIDFSDEELADIVSILRLINTFWVSFHQTQTIVNEVNDSVFYQGVLKILVILRPYTKAHAISELNHARDVYQQRYREEAETA